MSKPLLIRNEIVDAERGVLAVENGRITVVSSAPPAAAAADRFILDAMGHVVTTAS